MWGSVCHHRSGEIWFNFVVFFPVFLEFDNHVFWTWKISDRLPRIIFDIRKVTSPDQELNTILRHPSVLYYIKEVFLVSVFLKEVLVSSRRTSRDLRLLTHRFPTRLLLFTSKRKKSFFPGFFLLGGFFSLSFLVHEDPDLWWYVLSLRGE